MAPKLGILAGSGNLPARLVERSREQGREVFVLAIEGQTDPRSVENVEHSWHHIGAVAEAIATLRKAGVEEVVMAGPMTRPNFSELKLDMRHVYLYAKLGIGSLGDDGLLRGIIQFIEEQGFKVIGLDDILDHLLAAEQSYSRLLPDEQAQADIRQGIAAAVALGAADIGQAAVVQQGEVLGLEARDGTDALLERCASLARPGPGGVLVKVKKPGQESRADLPTIGSATVEGAARAGLRGIAVEAGGALIVDQDEVRALADRKGLFVVGVALSQ